jgi:hypothetical protein
MCEPNTPVHEDTYCVEGIITEVIYLGVNTRYIVTLSGGGEIAVLQQNLESRSSDVMASRGKNVWLMWDKAHTLRLD